MPQMPLKFSDLELSLLAHIAHKEDVSISELVHKALSQYIEKDELEEEYQESH